ncbi:MAG: hypothetical protein K8T20_17390 [Planctomycetes bacterium]|nr:hypothetical protein [Planctomycetota bacterium]
MTRAKVVFGLLLCLIVGIAAGPQLIALIPADVAPLHGMRPDELPSGRGPSGGPLRTADLEGEYFLRFGPGGASLDIEEDGDWSYSAAGCIGNGVRSRGVMSPENGRLIFHVKSSFLSPRGKACAGTVVFWGDWAYLLDERTISMFCQCANWSGADCLRDGEQLWFTRKGTRDGTSLVMPAELDRLVLRRPVHGVLGKGVATGWPANFGAADGAYIGLRVISEPSEGDLRYFDVVTLQEHSCGLRFTDGDKQSVPVEGMKVWCDAKSAAFVK